VRGCLERPGLMLVLDKGISCTGVAFRLPPEDKENQLLNILRREVIFVPHSFPPLWISVLTDQGTVPAVTFAMDRSSKSYVSGLTSDEVAGMLATASGPAGTMAEYLAQTVEHLESDGIHDPYLWDLQERVAEKLETLPR
jgi:glutathione-specific gamma-glutamylcyclotransferase